MVDHQHHRPAPGATPCRGSPAECPQRAGTARHTAPPTRQVRRRLGEQRGEQRERKQQAERQVDAQRDRARRARCASRGAAAARRRRAPGAGTAATPPAASPTRARARRTRARRRGGSCRWRSWARCPAARARCRRPGAPIRPTASSLIMRLRSSWRAASLSRISASTTTRSVPLAASRLPNTATQPRRTPARSPTACSSS